MPEPQRTLLFKVYKKVKYLDENYEEKEKEKVKTYDVDPVNDYILKKSYTNRTRMTKIEKIRVLANKRRFQESNQKQLAIMEKEKMTQLTNEINKEFSQKEKKKDANDKNNLDLNSDKNLNSNSHNIAENKIKNKENVDVEKKQEKLNSSNDIEVKNNSLKKKKKQIDSINNSNNNDSKDITNNDTYCSEKEIKSPIMEEILEENIIKLADEEQVKQKVKDEAKKENKKAAKELKPIKKAQKESDSEDMELEEDLDFNEDSNENESLEISDAADAVKDEELESSESGEAQEAEENEAEDYDEELEYYEDGEEYEFEEEMDFLDDEEGELDSQEEAYYENLYGKSISNIYSRIQGKAGNKDKAKNAEPKSQEEIDMQKSLIIARNNSIKNAMLKTSANNNLLLGKKRSKGLLNGSDNGPYSNNPHSKNTGNANENNKNGSNGQKKTHGSSVGPKKKVNFTLNKNTFNSKLKFNSNFTYINSFLMN